MIMSLRSLRTLSVTTITFLIALMTILVNPTSANAGVVPNSSCLGIDPNLYSGICIESNSGSSHTWLGNFRSANGSIFYCVDFLYSDTANPVKPYSSMKELKNKNGVSIPDASLRTLGYILGNYAPTSNTGNATTNAAIALLVREVMNDSNGFYAASGGGFLMPGGTVGKINNGSGWVTPPAILTQAQAYWNVGTQRYVGATGKYAVTVSTPNPVTETVPFSATINVKGAAGIGVPGLKVSLTATNGVLSAPSGVTNASGNVTVTATPNINVATMSITAKVDAVTYATYFKPVGWPTNKIQRAIVGATAVAAGNTTKTVTVLNATTTVRALKINKDTSTPLSGATLQLKSNGVNMGSWITDADGYTPYVSANVGSTVCVYELVTPPGFVAPPSSQALACQAITVPSVPITLTAQNTPTVLLVPTITTVTSSQQVTPNTAIYDTVTVANTGGATIPATWTLLGPVAPDQTATNACDKVDYSSAPVAASGAFTVTGDGTQNVGNFTPTVLGCYGYNETLEETATTAAAASTTSDPNETMLVKDALITPTVDTIVNDTAINIAGGNFDNVVISNTGGATINATVKVLGPMPANKTSATPCAGIDWTTAPTEHTDDWVIDGNNTYEVGQWEFLLEGCYTYVQSLPATWTTNAVTTNAGEEKETFVVTPVPLTPAVTTVVSSQNIVPNTPIYDTVSITGTKGAEIAGTWKLYGPVVADKTSTTPCAKVSWTKAPTAATGDFSVKGDGSYKTGEFTPISLGCYTYVETLAPTWTTGNVTTPTGVASETTLVKNKPVTPTITTQASSNKLQSGEGFYDNVIVNGFPTGESVTGKWETVGPVAPVAEGDTPCASVDWTNAPVVASGEMTITGDGTYKTETYTPAEAGCYSFRETFPAAWATTAFSTLPGDAAEEIVHVTAGVTPTPTPITPTPDPTVVITPDSSTPLAETGAGSILNIVAIGLLTLAFGGVLIGASTMIKKE